jgi:hypothetical protein
MTSRLVTGKSLTFFTVQGVLAWSKYSFQTLD